MSKSLSIAYSVQKAAKSKSAGRPVQPKDHVKAPCQSCGCVDPGHARDESIEEGSDISSNQTDLSSNNITERQKASQRGLEKSSRDLVSAASRRVKRK